MAKGLRKRVFPLKSGKKRQKGKQKVPIGFRAPDDVAEWLQKLQAEGADKTETIVTSIRLGRDVYQLLGDRWYEVEYRAKRQGKEPGAMLAELAIQAIEAENTAPAKPAKK